MPCRGGRHSPQSVSVGFPASAKDSSVRNQFILCCLFGVRLGFVLFGDRAPCNTLCGPGRLPRYRHGCAPVRRLCFVLSVWILVVFPPFVLKGLAFPSVQSECWACCSEPWALPAFLPRCAGVLLALYFDMV